MCTQRIRYNAFVFVLRMPRLLLLLTVLLLFDAVALHNDIDGRIFTKVLDDLARDSLGVQDIQVMTGMLS